MSAAADGRHNVGVVSSIIGVDYNEDRPVAGGLLLVGSQLKNLGFYDPLWVNFTNLYTKRYLQVRGRSGSGGVGSRLVESCDVTIGDALTLYPVHIV